MIILFNGPPGSGKDHAAAYFKQHDFKHLSFKYQLYIETIKYFGVDTTWFMNGYNDRYQKEVKCKQLDNMSRREAMIHVSEKIIKPKNGLDYFGRLVAAEINTEKNYCISDGGFIDELIPVLKKVGNDNFILVQLTRHGHDFSSDSRRYFDGNVTHELIVGSKTNIENKYVLPHKFNVKTYRVHNNGAVLEFERALQKIFINEINNINLN